MSEHAAENHSVSPWAGVMAITLVLGFGCFALLSSASAPSSAEAGLPKQPANGPGSSPPVSLYSEAGAHAPSDKPVRRPAEPASSLFGSD